MESICKIKNDKEKLKMKNHLDRTKFRAQEKYLDKPKKAKKTKSSKRAADKNCKNLSSPDSDIDHIRGRRNSNNERNTSVTGSQSCVSTSAPHNNRVRGSQTHNILPGFGARSSASVTHSVSMSLPRLSGPGISLTTGVYTSTDTRGEIHSGPFNESLRWEYENSDPDKEHDRILLYKENRRKRYLAARANTGKQMKGFAEQPSSVESSSVLPHVRMSMQTSAH